MKKLLIGIVLLACASTSEAQFNFSRKFAVDTLWVLSRPHITVLNRMKMNQQFYADTISSDLGAVLISDSLRITGYGFLNNIQAHSGNMVAVRDTFRTTLKAGIGSATSTIDSMLTVFGGGHSTGGLKIDGIMRAGSGIFDTPLDTAYTNAVSRIVSNNTFLSLATAGKSNFLTVDTTKVATSSLSGFLKFSDWVTFNNKVSSVSAGNTFITIGGTATNPTVASDTTKIATNSLTGFQSFSDRARLANTSGTNTGDVSLAGTPDYITISNQVITRGLIDLTTDVTGDLPYANLAQASAASRLFGRGSASGAGDWQEITLGSGLTMTGTELSANIVGSAGGWTNFTPRIYTTNVGDTVHVRTVAADTTGAGLALFNNWGTSYLKGATNFGAALSMGGTQWMDASRNLSNIGTISSGAITITSQSPNPGIRLTSISSPASNIWDLRIRDIVEGDFQIYDVVNNVSRFYIKNDGNVGIGTTSPANKLHIVGTDGNMRSSNMTLQIGRESIVNDVQGINFLGGIAVDYVVGRNANNDDLVFGTDNGGTFSERVRFTSAGNVGIGTTSPAAKLAINGGLHVGGDSDPGDNNALIDGSLSVTGAGTFGGDVAVSGGDITSSATTFNLLNATVTKGNMFGAADTINVGSSSGVMIHRKHIRVDSAFVLKERSDTPLTPTSGQGWIYEKTDNKLYFKNDGGTEYDLTVGSSSAITALTSDVTATGPGSVAATIANDAVSNAKMANMATQTFKGRNTAGTGDPEDLSVATVKTMLNNGTATEGNGFAAVIDYAQGTSAAAVSATAMSNTTGTAVYRVSVYLETVTATTGSASMTLHWEASGGPSKTETTSSIDLSIDGAYTYRVFVVEHSGAGSTSLQYSTSYSGTGSYRWVIVTERLAP